jgi:hypothetical protein
MNRTKRKIFETSMKLFSEKGYDATSIEEITAVGPVGEVQVSNKDMIFTIQ